MKETFYFPHDYNAFNDEKIIKLRRKLGIEGYGIYWVLVERLAASSEGRLNLSDIEDIAFDMQVDIKRIADVVHGYNLFKTDKTHFWSNRLLSFFAERELKSDKAKKAAKVRWALEAKENADAMQTQCEGNAIKERKGNKGKEIKENAPAWILEICTEHNFKPLLNYGLIKSARPDLTDDKFRVVIFEIMAWREAKKKSKEISTTQVLNWLKGEKTEVLPVSSWPKKGETIYS